MPTQNSTKSITGRKVLITGGNGLAGPYMHQRLISAGFDVCALGRRPIDFGRSVIGDLARPERIVLDENFDTLVHLAPLWLLPQNLTVFSRHGVNRVVAFSSTSVDSKSTSPDDRDRKLARRLSDAEEGVRDRCLDLCIALSILRPTMIYGFGRDKNVMSIAKLIKRLGFFPVAGAGAGLRQPVHVLDTVQAAYQCAIVSGSAGKTYNIAGGECLTYKTMVCRIFEGLNRKPRLIHLPQRLYTVLLSFAAGIGLIKDFSPGAAARMNENLNFDIADARRDLAFEPAGFLTNPQRDLI